MPQLWWVTILGVVGGATLLVGFVSDAAERRGPVLVDLGKGRYRCATLLQRYVAHLIDSVILLGTVLLPGLLCGARAGGGRDPWTWVAALAFALAYFVVCEACWGQTPGKRLVRIRVAGPDGLHPDWKSAFSRNTARVADTFFLGYAVGTVAYVRSPERQRLGDRLARTWVVAEAVLDDETARLQAGRPIPDAAAVQGFTD